MRIPKVIKQLKRPLAIVTFGLLCSLGFAGGYGKYIYGGFALYREIVATPNHAFIVDDWGVVQLKSIKYALLNNVADVSEEWIDDSDFGARLSVMRIPAGNYGFRCKIYHQTGERAGLIAYDYDFSGFSEWPKAPRGRIVMLHGYASFKEAMLPGAILLAQTGFDVVLVDLPRHGASGEGGYTFGRRDGELLAKLSTVVFGKSDFRRFVVGCSFGARIAMEWAALDSSIDGVISVAPFVDIEESTRRFISNLDLGVEPGSIDIALAVLRMRGCFDYASDSVSGRAKFIVIIPELDKITSRSEYESLVMRFAGVELVQIKGASHSDAMILAGDVLGCIEASLNKMVNGFIDNSEHCE